MGGSFLIKPNVLAAQLLSVAVVVLALMSFTQRAHASCGYYVLTTHPGTELAGAAAMPMEQHPLTPADCPCRGPQCSAGHQGAVPAAPAPTFGLDAFAAIFADSHLQPEPISALSIPPLQFDCEPHVVPIDPPPRA